MLHLSPTVYPNILTDWGRRVAGSVNQLIGKFANGKLDAIRNLDLAGHSGDAIVVTATEDGFELAAGAGGGTTSDALTLNNGGAGAASGATFDGSSPVTVSYNTVGAQPSDSTLTALAAFNSNGLLTQTAADTFAARTLTGPAAGLGITNGDGVAGNPTIALANDLAALEGLSGTGLVTRTGSETYAERTIAGTANQLTVTNGDGVSGNPTIALATYAYEANPTAPTTADFTLQNAGTATVSDASNGRGIVLVTPTVASSQIRFVRKNGAPPATPYSIVMRSAHITAGSNTGIYKSCLILRNSTSGRLLIFGDYNSGQILVQTWNGYTGFNANVIAPVSEWAGIALPWKRIRNDGTSLFFALSPDGENWHEYGTSATIASYLTATGGTLDEIGFGTMSNNPGFTNRTIFNSFTAA